MKDLNPKKILDGVEALLTLATIGCVAIIVGIAAAVGALGIWIASLL